MAEDAPAAVVAAAHNAAYPDAEPLTPGDVEVVETGDHTAVCLTTADGLRFAHDPAWWARSTASERVGLVCHELGHVERAGHGPAFWRAVADAYDALRESPERVAEAVDGEVDWDEVRAFLVDDPTTREVEIEEETAYERRRWLADRLGYEGEVRAFANCRIIASQYGGDEYRRLHLSEVEYEDPGAEALLAYLRQSPHPALRRGTDEYVVTRPPAVRETADGYEAARGEELLALLHRAGHTKTTVEVVGGGGA